MSLKKLTSLLILLTGLTLSGCTQTSKKPRNSSSNSNPSISTSEGKDSSSGSSDESSGISTSISSSQSTSSGITSSTSDEIIDDDSDIEYITMNQKEVEILIGKAPYSLTITFHFKDGVDEDSVNKDVIWTSSDTSIATVSQYGQVSGVSKGQTLITCTTVEGSRRASCVVYVIESEALVVKEWQKVTAVSQLKAGDLIIMGCPEMNVAATSESVGMYLHPTNVTYLSSGDKITSVGVAEQFMLDGDASNGFMFESEDGKYLCTTHTGKVTFIYKTGNNKWDIDYDQGVCDMQSTSSISGWFMYNSSQQKFTTYESNPQVDMFVITLYKQVRIYS